MDPHVTTVHDCLVKMVCGAQSCLSLALRALHCCCHEPVTPPYACQAPLCLLSDRTCHLHKPNTCRLVCMILVCPLQCMVMTSLLGKSVLQGQAINNNGACKCLNTSRCKLAGAFSSLCSDDRCMFAQISYAHDGIYKVHACVTQQLVINADLKQGSWH